LGEVLSLNISTERGVDKTCVPEVVLVNGWGIKGDAHGGEWDRQVSILPVEAIEKMPQAKRGEISNGGYTENITIAGIPLVELTVGKTLQVGTEALVKIIHIGKEEFKERGRPYVVSREGRFGVVVKGGKVKVGDTVCIVEG
jgi:MOSC domain-containing protein YiiM